MCMNKQSYSFITENTKITITKLGSWWNATARKNGKLVSWENKKYRAVCRDLPHQAAVTLAANIGLDQGKMMSAFDAA